MAQLLPADFDLDGLEHSERRVCEAMMSGLDDTWLVIPSVPIVDHGDAEIDLLLVSPSQGVVLVEVKGGAVRLIDGDWYQYDRKLSKSPPAQAVRAKYALIKRLKSARVDIEGLFVNHVVALPDVGSVPREGLGPDAPASIVLAKPELLDPSTAIKRLGVPDHVPVPNERLERFVRAIRPTIELVSGDGGVMQATSRQLDATTRAVMAAVRGMDSQQRVLVTGGAGTGKTWLAIDWAKRAVERGERTLVVCFNKPIGEFLHRRLRGTPATVGTYHDVAVRLLEPHGFRVGENPEPEYWDKIPTASLAFHADKIGQPFDTLIIDEGQDIKPHWLESLERLLDPAGPQRVLMVADPSQAIYDRDWTPPPNIVTNRLEHNLRNSRPIASFVKRLGGPEPMPGAPGNVPVRLLVAGGRKEIAKRVRDTVVELTQQHGVPYSEILVVTRHKKERDDLVASPPDGCPMVRWEGRSEDAVLCETVHRAKGLERLAVIYVDTSAEPDRQLQYIGSSRAVSWLTLIGSDALMSP